MVAVSDNMTPFPIGDTVLFLDEDEVEELRDELEACCQVAEVRGVETIDIPGLRSLSLEEARGLAQELEVEEPVNWMRDGY